MTPKEKAEVLVNRFNLFVYCFVGSGMLTNDADDSAIRMNAKQCALIAVDEIEKALTDYGRGDSLQLQNMDSEFRFWEQVKQEIQKI